MQVNIPHRGICSVPHNDAIYNFDLVARHQAGFVRLVEGSVSAVIHADINFNVSGFFHAFFYLVAGISAARGAGYGGYCGALSLAYLAADQRACNAAGNGAQSGAFSGLFNCIDGTDNAAVGADRCRFCLWNGCGRRLAIGIALSRFLMALFGFGGVRRLDIRRFGGSVFSVLVGRCRDLRLALVVSDLDAFLV